LRQSPNWLTIILFLDYLCQSYF